MEPSVDRDPNASDVDRIEMRAADQESDRHPNADAYAEAELERRNEAMERIIEKARRFS